MTQRDKDMNRSQHVVFQVIASSPQSGSAFDIIVEGYKEAVRAAKTYSRSGFTTIINQLRETENGGYHVVKLGRPRAPKFPPRHERKGK